MSAVASELNLSIVIPVHDEEENIIVLVKEINSGLAALQPFEIICIDDSSTDRTLQLLRNLQKVTENLRILHLTSHSGQSAAILQGVKHARARLIATMDGDGQNDPRDILKLLSAYNGSLRKNESLMVVGFRRNRRDSFAKRLSSGIANSIRRFILKDKTPDTGCGLKIFPRELYLNFPHFDHMHRFLPVLVNNSGGKVISVEVNHRPRSHGNSHYGIWNRLWIGIIDLGGVWWLKKRTSFGSKVEEVTEKNA